MVLSHLEGFEYTFTDCDRGHHDDEFAPAIDPVKFHNGLDVDVGFTSTGFHLNIKVRY